MPGQREDQCRDINAINVLHILVDHLHILPIRQFDLELQKHNNLSYIGHIASRGEHYTSSHIMTP